MNIRIPRGEEYSFRKYKDSNDLVERGRYLHFLKLALKRSQNMLEGFDKRLPWVIKMEMKYINKLKDEITAYDIYRQKKIFRCFNCNEDPCVCGEIDEHFGKILT